MRRRSLATARHWMRIEAIFSDGAAKEANRVPSYWWEFYGEMTDRLADGDPRTACRVFASMCLGQRLHHGG